MKTNYLIIKYCSILFFIGIKSFVFGQCWSKVAAGSDHTLAIATNGTLWGWGSNTQGQLGIGTNNNGSLVPIQIGTANNWVAIVAGSTFSIAIRASGVLGNSNTLWAWGSNSYGQLGDGTFIDKNSPTQVGTNTKWTKISASTNFCMAINDSGTLFTPGNKTLWGWGRNNVGQLGNGITSNQNIPIQIGTAIDWGQVATGSNYTIAQKMDGKLYSWGFNNYGQLGINSTATTTLRTQIGNDSDWSNNITAGDFHSLAIKNNGTLWAWGHNLNGQLGTQTQINSLIPIQIGSDSDWTKVEAGAEHTVALKNNSDVYTWGRDNYGQLGNGQITFTLVRTLVAVNTIDIQAGKNHTLAIRTNNILTNWGNNEFGELGIGSTTNMEIPTYVACPVSLSVDDGNKIDSKFTLYPNPTTNGLFSIQSKTSIKEVTAFDILGKEISVEKNNNSYMINASSGIYTIKISDSDGNSQIKKIIIN